MKLLLTGDKHLREDTPVCRTDDYWKAQKRKMEFIQGLQREYNALQLDSGDIFNHWKPSPYLLGWTIDILREWPEYNTMIMSVPGNHDMPQHNPNLIDRSGYGVLEIAEIIDPIQYTNPFLAYQEVIIYRVPWGNMVRGGERPKDQKNKFRILLIHTLVYEGKPPWPGAEKQGTQAESFLRKYDYDLIISGHNHQTICIVHNGRYLVNPGSMMRMTAAQTDHRPCVFLFDTDTRECKQIFLPIKEDVVNREHIEIGERKDERIESFINTLKDDVEIGLSFRNNLERYIKANSVNTSVEREIWKALDVDNERSIK